MYHCHTHFYLVGRQPNIFKIIKKMSPLENFTHEFFESNALEETIAAKADVILLCLQDIDAADAMRALTSFHTQNKDIILLAAQNQVPLLTDYLLQIKDLWILPMSDEELQFRFLRWQQAYKASKDFWQTSQFLETTIDNVPNLIWYKDKNGIHEMVNDSFCKTVGKTKQQAQGRGHAYIWNVDHDDPACIESEKEVMSKEQTCVSEEIIQTGDGTRTLTTYKSPLYDLDGSVMGTVGVAIDITQERAYREELSKKNETLETIFTTLDCGVMRHSLDGRQVFSINKAALKLLGYESLNELLADGFNLIASSVMDEDKAKLRNCIQTLEKVGDSVSVEYRVQHKNGEILHIMGNVKLLKENEQLVYQRFLLDCTAQKLQEKKEKERQMELIHALSVDFNLVYSFDSNTGKGIQIRNDAPKESIFGSIFNERDSLDMIMARYIQEFVYDDDKEMLQMQSSLESIKKELTENNMHSVNYRTFINNKITYYQMKTVRAGADDNDYSIVLGFRSVDEEMRKEMEQKSLLENALMQATKASKAKSVFLSNMSHDIRTPMNAVVGFTNLAITHIDNKEQVLEYLKKIITSGNHLLSLINDVLDMSHIESGKIHLEEAECTLPDILHGLRNILQADINAKQLELQIDTVDVFDEEIYCDKLRLNQVLLNILSNSVKYTTAGGIISMRITEKAGAPKGYATYEFFIKDTGIGMSKEFVEHIFEPFEREQNSTTSGIQGTGLGMAITKNIIDMMNGSVQVKSELGVGTEFTVTFTFRLHTEAKDIQDILELKNCRALVVDDDFNTCDSVSYMLGQLGLRAEWTLSGKEGVLRTRQAVMRNNDYHVYIIDWLLPDMNGIEVTRRIRKEIGDQAPVIIMTAYDWSDIETEAKEAGVTAFCSKPLFLSELRNCLQSIIKPENEDDNKADKKQDKLRSGRILLAEDVELNQEIAAAILGDAGFTTEIAGNGQIALDMLKNSEPGYYQLILMDVQMPIMNGYDATKAIRQIENKELASIPIIAMTANAFEEDKHEALSVGMNGHIAKPIDVENLFTTLDTILS